MKYTAILISAIVMLLTGSDHVSARNYELQSDIPVRNVPAKVSIVGGALLQAGDKTGREAMKARKADGDNSTIEGNWIFTLGDFYTEVALDAEVEAEYVAVLEDGEVTFTDETGEYFPMKAAYDEETGELFFRRDFLMTYRGYYLYQLPFVWNPEKENQNERFEYQPITANYLADEGLIFFAADNGIYWGGAADAAGNNIQGYFAIYDIIEASPTLPWTPLGKGSFLENIVYPVLNGGSENKRYVQVDVEESQVTPGIFRIRNAFQASYVSMLRPPQTPAMILDAREADNVLIQMQSTGLSANIDGGTGGRLFYFNDAWHLLQYGWAINSNGPVLCWFSADPDGTFMINIPSRSCYIYASTTQNYYNASAFGSTLIFDGSLSGVEETVGVADDAPAQYFNLQGLRVQNPSPGQVLIMRRGAKIEKILY